MSPEMADCGDTKMSAFAPLLRDKLGMPPPKRKLRVNRVSAAVVEVHGPLRNRLPRT
jgi:hypothetical protein